MNKKTQLFDSRTENNNINTDDIQKLHKITRSEYEREIIDDYTGYEHHEPDCYENIRGK